MDLIFALVSVALTLALPIAVVVLLVARFNRARAEEDEPDEPGIGTVRRLFLYGLAAVSLALAATGVALLLGGLLGALFGDLVVADSDTRLAVALSLTVVGLPAWFVFMWLAQRSVQAYPVEARTDARWFYLAGVRAVAFVVAVVFAISVGRALLRTEEFDAGDWGWFLVASAVWAVHQLEAARHPVRARAVASIDRAYRAFGAAFSLAVLALGVAVVVTEALSMVYDAAFRPTLVQVGPWDRALREGLVQALVGGVAWWWSWLRAPGGLRAETRTTSWHVVVFLFGILAGLAAAVIAAAADL